MKKILFNFIFVGWFFIPALSYSQNIGMTLSNFQNEFSGDEEITTESHRQKEVRVFGYKVHNDSFFDNYFEHYFYFYDDML
jgi:hypothetical protein